MTGSAERSAIVVRPWTPPPSAPGAHRGPPTGAVWETLRFLHTLWASELSHGRARALAQPSRRPRPPGASAISARRHSYLSGSYARSPLCLLFIYASHGPGPIHERPRRPPRPPPPEMRIAAQGCSKGPNQHPIRTRRSDKFHWIHPTHRPALSLSPSPSPSPRSGFNAHAGRLLFDDIPRECRWHTTSVTLITINY